MINGINLTNAGTDCSAPVDTKALATMQRPLCADVPRAKGRTSKVRCRV